MEPVSSDAYNLKKTDEADFLADGDVDEDLVEAETRDEVRLAKERLDQRLGDAEVITALQLSNFDESSVEWDVLADALAEYGFGVMTGWLITGMATQKAREMRNGLGVLGMQHLPKENLRMSRDDARALAGIIAAEALKQFREKTLMNPNPDKRWSPTGGASLKTFYIGRCLMVYPNEYRRWERENSSLGQSLEKMVDNGVVPAAEDRKALTNLELSEVLATLDERAQRIFGLKAAGWTDQQIAELESTEDKEVTVAALQSFIFRTREKLRKGMK